MRKLLAIIVCKLLRYLLKLFGKGSSLPGKIALKIDENILSEISLPRYIIAVTGSNGKTSTVEMINQVLLKAGYSVAYNKEGSNQIEGVTTLLLSNTSLDGVFNKDVLLIESDERYARHTFRFFKPTHYIITNLYRDQLTRNGHHEWIYDIIKESIYDESVLVLNADDPLIATYGLNRDNVYYFGIEENETSSKTATGVYDDGKYCPVCKSRMDYDYHHFSHIGKYHCPECGFERKDPDYKITGVNLDEGYLVIDERYEINLALKSIYNAYNILSAYSIARILNVDPKIIAETLNNYILKNGRAINFRAGDHDGMFLISKHENSVSYNQSLTVARNHKGDVTCFIMVDAISRKYFTSETSWLWDIDFELLNSDNIRHIVLTGQYANDVALRLSYTGVDFDKVYINPDIAKAIAHLKENAVGFIYTITCFSDEHKFLSEVEVKS